MTDAEDFIQAHDGLKRELKDLQRYNHLMRLSLAHKSLKPEEIAELEDLKECFRFLHTAQAGIVFAERLIVEYELILEAYLLCVGHTEEKPVPVRGLLGIFK